MQSNMQSKILKPALIDRSVGQGDGGGTVLNLFHIENSDSIELCVDLKHQKMYLKPFFNSQFMQLIAFLIALCQCNDGLSQLINKKLYMSPASDPKVYLHLLKNVVNTLSTPEAVIMKKEVSKLYGSKERWLIFFNGKRICHKADNTIGSCDTEGTVNNVWNVIQIENNTYAVESEGMLVNYCVTYNKNRGSVNMSPCDRFYESQYFILTEPNAKKGGSSASNIEDKLTKFKKGFETFSGLRNKILGVFSELNGIF